MTAAEAIQKIKAREVARAAILDRHGAFAKRPEDIDHVNLEFDDATLGTISASDYNALTLEDKDEIHNAGALPQELEPS